MWVIGHRFFYVVLKLGSQMTNLFLLMDSFISYHSPLISRPDKPNSLLPGSCMFVSSTLSPEHPSICDEAEQVCSLLNVACCIVTCRHHRIAVMSVYRSPSVSGTTCIAELKSVLLLLSSRVHTVVMAGDLNINLLSTIDSITRAYSDLLTDFQLAQHIMDATPVCGSSATLIDHIVSTSALDVVNSFQASGISDHRIQVVDFHFLL